MCTEYACFQWQDFLLSSIFSPYILQHSIGYKFNNDSIPPSFPPSPACGIQFCLECEEAESEDDHDECTECLPNTVLYHEEGECLYGLRREILEVVEEQEHEVEEEERERNIARIECELSYHSTSPPSYSWL